MSHINYKKELGEKKNNCSHKQTYRASGVTSRKQEINAEL